MALRKQWLQDLRDSIHGATSIKPKVSCTYECVALALGYKNYNRLRLTALGVVHPNVQAFLDRDAITDYLRRKDYTEAEALEVSAAVVIGMAKMEYTVEAVMEALRAAAR